MTRVRDISVAIGPGLPVWPTSRGYRVSQAMQLSAGDPANVTWLELDVHTGTHVEAPLHFLADGAALDTIELERFVGPAQVARVAGPAITSERLEAIGLPRGVERLLLRTSNSERWRRDGGAFDPDYVALTPEAAAWIVGRGIRLVGIDHLSIQQYGSDGETHRILMRAGVAILEGLDLSEVEPGAYTLVCVPIRLSGTEAAPVRAILLSEETDER